MSAFEPGELVRFRAPMHSITIDEDYVVCPAPDQRGAHLLTWVRKLSIGILERPFGVGGKWLHRVEGAA
jgi:hypothetical protein